MVRRKTNRRTDGRDSSGIQSVTVSFTCPTCATRNSYGFMYIPRGLSSKNQLVSANYCRCKECEAAIVVSYRIKRTQKGQFTIKIFKCICDGTEYTNKRYRILQPKRP